MTESEFRTDLRDARDAIEQAGGVPVVGFRAPTWSINRASGWALEILADEGFHYDSSIFPVRHDLYGTPDAPRFPYVHALPSGRRLHEFPPTTVRVLGVNLPGAGGGYLRILPLAYTRWVLRRLENAEKQPAMVYVHPWELDPGQPRVAVPLRSRLRHYTNLARTEGRLERLLERHRFQPISARLSAASAA
jgi:polysaccharide deacetylase family protein (PEP-CTERM system associated)